MKIKKCPYCGVKISILKLRGKCGICNNEIDVNFCILKTSISFSLIYLLYKWFIWDFVGNLYINIFVLSLISGFIALYFSVLRKVE